jgi:outer membrane protein assembly factor BamB
MKKKVFLFILFILFFLAFFLRSNYSEDVLNLSFAPAENGAFNLFNLEFKGILNNGCFDSDGGLNYEQKGNVGGGTWYTNGHSYDLKTDICVDSDILKEYYCFDEFYAYYIQKSCSDLYGSEYRCENGKCMPTMVFVGTVDPTVYALSLFSGNEIWSYEDPADVLLGPDGGYEGYSVYNEGVLYYPDDSGLVQALNLFTGEIIWTNETCLDWMGADSGDWPSQGLPLGQNINNIIIENDILYFANYHSYDSFNEGEDYYGIDFFAFDLNNLDYVWNYSERDVIASFGRPIIYDDIFYVGSSENIFYAVDINDGSLLWKKEIGIYPTTPLVFNDVLYVVDESKLLALDLKTGSVYDSYYVFGISRINDFIVDSDYIYLSAGNELYSLSLEGNLVWSYSMEEYYYSVAFLLSDGLIYNSQYRSDEIVALDSETGNLVWSTFLNGDAVDFYNYDGILIVPTNEGYVYAFDAERGSKMWVNKLENKVSSGGTIYDGTFEFDSSIRSRFGVRAYQ